MMKEDPPVEVGETAVVEAEAEVAVEKNTLAMLELESLRAKRELLQ